MESPRFSVVIPAYNAERCIEAALDSVARQTTTDYEVIVVDDGSADATFQRVTVWAAAHPALTCRVIRKAHGGLGDTRNVGMQYACGEYLAFLDADDLWLEQKLEAVARCLQHVPGAQVVCHDERLEEQGRRTRRLRHGPYTTYRELLFEGNVLSPSATVVQRLAVEAVGGFSTDPAFHGAEDYDLWLRLAQQGCRFSYLREVHSVYRVHHLAMTDRIEEHHSHVLNVVEAHFHRWTPSTFSDRYRMRRRRAHVLRGAGRMLMRRGEHRQALAFLRRALRQDPFSWKAWCLAAASAVRVPG